MRDLLFILSCYDRDAVKDLLSALRSFIRSETYHMLSDTELEMWEFQPVSISGMWEVEQETGGPRDSVYIKGYGHDI